MENDPLRFFPEELLPILERLKVWALRHRRKRWPYISQVQCSHCSRAAHVHVYLVKSGQCYHMKYYLN